MSPFDPNVRINIMTCGCSCGQIHIYIYIYIHDNDKRENTWIVEEKNVLLNYMTHDSIIMPYACFSFSYFFFSSPRLWLLWHHWPQKAIRLILRILFICQVNLGHPPSNTDRQECLVSHRLRKCDIKQCDIFSICLLLMPQTVHPGPQDDVLAAWRESGPHFQAG